MRKNGRFARFNWENVDDVGIDFANRLFSDSRGQCEVFKRNECNVSRPDPASCVPQALCRSDTRRGSDTHEFALRQQLKCLRQGITSRIRERSDLPRYLAVNSTMEAGGVSTNARPCERKR
jgi:hypothetical protein